MQSSQKGLLYATLAFTLWGFFPFYFTQVSHIPPLEILANRIIWSALLLLFIIYLRNIWSSIGGILRHPKQKYALTLSSVFIALNWGVYIWAIDNQRIFEASLGYYINPLVNIVLGVLFLGERLRRLQWLAVLLATIGVIFQVMQLNHVPWVALCLAFSFGFYGLIHKKISEDAVPCLFLETLLLLPIALMFLGYLSTSGQGPMLWKIPDWGLLILAGPVTVIPLLLFSTGVKTVAYSIIGFLQYIVPSLLFFLAAFVYDEPFSIDQLITFLFIWTAIIFISIDAIKHSNNKAKVRNQS